MNKWCTQKSLEWITKILNERFGISFELRTQDAENKITICIPGNPRKITMDLYSVIFASNDSKLPCATWTVEDKAGWTNLLDVNLPAPGCTSLPTPLITNFDHGMHVAYDILGLTYWMLTRQEEVGRIDLDMHGRFPATSSHAFKHGYLGRPLVDEWLYILGQVIKRTWNDIELKQNTFSIKLSHDVDRPSRYGYKSIPALTRAIAGDLIKRRNFKSAFVAPWVRMNTRTQLNDADPANTFGWLMDVSERHGLQSAFYFICGHTDPHDADYQPEHPTIRNLMRRIHQRGHEIGLHPSYGTYQKPHLIIEEADRLRRICAEEGIQQKEWGGRMHYLRWQQPITMQALNDAGMSYDSTLGYADAPGFRCGTCFEYPAFNSKTQEVLRLRINPLIVMESTLIGRAFNNQNEKENAIEEFFILKNVCKRINGTYNILWHNDSLMDEVSKDLYKNILSMK